MNVLIYTINDTVQLYTVYCIPWHGWKHADKSKQIAGIIAVAKHDQSREWAQKQMTTRDKLVETRLKSEIEMNTRWNNKALLLLLLNI